MLNLTADVDVRLEHPFTCIVSGPTKAGKTELVMQLVRHASTMIDPAPAHILWCYGEAQPAYKKLEGLCQLHDGPPPENWLKSNPGTPKLVIADDFMLQDSKSEKNTVALFTKGCHHWNVSVIHIVQNLFHGSRTKRVNAQYLVLLKCPSDKIQVMTLARQLFPGQQKFFLEAFADATAEPHGYLFVDLGQHIEDSFRLRTKILPTDPFQIVYLPQNS